VARLPGGARAAGYHAVVVWDGATGTAPGVYFARFTAAGRSVTRRIVVLAASR